MTMNVSYGILLVFLSILQVTTNFQEGNSIYKKFKQDRRYDTGRSLFETFTLQKRNHSYDQLPSNTWPFYLQWIFDCLTYPDKLVDYFEVVDYFCDRGDKEDDLWLALTFTRKVNKPASVACRAVWFLHHCSVLPLYILASCLFVSSNLHIFA